MAANVRWIPAEISQRRAVSGDNLFRWAPLCARGRLAVLAIAVELLAPFGLVSAAEPPFDLLAAAEPPFSEVRSFALSPDGSRVAFFAYRDGEYGIYSLSIPGGPVHELSSGPVSLDGLAITPDSARVLYQDSPARLWSVPIDGPSSEAVDMSACLPDGLTLEWFQLLGGTDSLAILATSPPPGLRDLFVVSSAGCKKPAIRLNPKLTGTENVFALSSSSDGSVVSFLISSPPDDRGRLYITAVDHPKPKLIVPLSEEQTLGSLPCAFAEDQPVCVFLSDLETPGRLALFSVRTGEKDISVVRISGDLPSNVAVALDYRIAPDDENVVYQASGRLPTFEEISEVFVTPLEGPLTSSRPLSSGNFLPEASAKLFAISHDGGWAGVAEFVSATRQQTLFGIPINGTWNDAEAISPTLMPDETAAWFSPLPVEANLLFSAVMSPPTKTRCFVTALDGSSGIGHELWTTDSYKGLGLNSTDCQLQGRGDGAISLLADLPPLAGDAYFRWSSTRPPADPEPFHLANVAGLLASGFDNVDYRITSDGAWALFLGWTVPHTLSLWALPLPEFYDGFESGGLGHWASSAPGPT